MVQEFKDYDKVYSKFKGKFMAYETGQGFCEMMAEADSVTEWTYKVGKYTNAEIRNAVYFAEGFEEWQKFRVSLKGFNTKEKLVRLWYRRGHFKCADATEGLAALERLRIDNYLGALVRGGQLSTTHVVQR